MKTTTKLNSAQVKRMQQVLSLSGEDFSYSMENPADQMLCAGMSAKSVLDSLRDAAERFLWLASTDFAAALGVDLPDEFANCTGPLRTLVIKAADRAAKNLLRAVEVTDALADAVPPVSARRGAPAALAASLGLA